ncbi:peptidase domain-containing ABC transporter [Magnetospirillum sp. SS-4]|uniref:peptidase domain-containing ABC transporter n=1 Tax=Magnetospirillum sp. SS-4 TaxID=2681465 RepID=UPI00137E89C0|nr:ABC transporter transmembrane domain-containing protein [Magnetospirillum sp. SS-4]CAA7622688.1 conserved membrane hypothetical protein [Magnetospirillum sp. SS-4]
MSPQAVQTMEEMARYHGDERVNTNAFARCIVPLIDSLGWRGHRTHLAEALPHFPEGMGLVELLNTMANLKFESRIVPGRLDEIDPRQMPCLFVSASGSPKVMVGAVGKELLAYDGDLGGYINIKAEAIPGEVVFFTIMRGNSESFLKPQTGWFGRVLGRFKLVFVQAFVISLLISILAMISPALVMLIYDNVLASRSMETLVWVAGGMTIFVVAEGGFRFLRSYLFQYVGVRLSNLVGNEVLRRLLYLPPSLTETSNLGAQVSRVRDFESVREFFSGPAIVALFELPFILLLVVALVVIAGSLAYVPLAGISLFIIFGLAIRPVISRANAAGAHEGSERQAFIIEMLSNLRAIKYTSVSRLWAERYKKLSAEASIAAYRVTCLNALITAVSHILVAGAAVATLSIGVNKVFAGEMTPGGLMAAMALVWRILAPLGTGFGVITQVGRIAKSVDQVDRLMVMRLESREDAATAITAAFKGKVAFSNVSIRYSADAAPALVGINFVSNPNEITAIVGHDGAGKTTVLKLILGLYTPQAGRILIDDTNIRQLDPVLLRRHVAYMPKTTHFFHGTIAQNLKLANPTAGDRDIETACQQAGVLEGILGLPQGFDTRIGDHNIAQLPMGLRKRLSLARVFLRKSKLILLDEPESGLSIEEIADFTSMITTMRESSTLLVVTGSQRIMSVADNVMWLETGRIRMWDVPQAVTEQRLLPAQA